MAPKKKALVDPRKQEDALRNKLQGLAATLTKTDRILTGNVKVHVQFSPPAVAAPSATDGETIWIDPKRIEIGSASGLVNLLGLNYHEVCHILFSPRRMNYTLRDINAKGFHKAWNILEDMRIETLFSAMYGRASKFFTAPVVTYIVNNQATWETAHLLTYGRRFLPKAIREEFREQFKGTDAQCAEAERIIDAYRKVCYDKYPPRSVGANTPDKHIVGLVEDFHKLIADLIGSDPNPLQDHPDCASSERGQGKIDQDASEMASQRRDEDDAADDDGESETANGADTAQEDPEEDDSDDAGEHGGDADSDVPDDEGDDGDAGDGQDESGDDVSGADEPVSGSDDDDSGSGEGDDANSDSSSEWEADSPEDDHPDGDHGDGGAVGKASGRSPDEVADDIRNAISDVLDDILASDDVKNEITTVQAGMDDSTHVDFAGDRKKGYTVPVNYGMVSASCRAEEELRRLREQFEAGWNRGTDYGVLNVARALETDYDPESMYDIWEEGNEEDSGLEVVILLDMSVSMKEPTENADGSPPYDNPTRMMSACSALWILKRALDLNEATTSVLGFGTDMVKVYGRDDKVEAGRYESYSAQFYGTNPIEELNEARRILDASDKPNRLLVLITDGQVTSGGYGQGTPEHALSQIDATRMLVQIGKCEGQRDEFIAACDVSCNVYDTGQLVDLVRDTVTSLLLRKVRS